MMQTRFVDNNKKREHKQKYPCIAPNLVYATVKKAPVAMYSLLEELLQQSTLKLILFQL